MGGALGRRQERIHLLGILPRIRFFAAILLQPVFRCATLSWTAISAQFIALKQNRSLLVCWSVISTLPKKIKNLFRILSVLTALSLTAFVYAKEEKKEASCDKEQACSCKDGSCDHCKAEKAKAEKEAAKK